MRGFNDWNGRDQDAPLRILAAVYAHYLRNRDRVYDGGDIGGRRAGRRGRRSGPRGTIRRRRCCPRPSRPSANARRPTETPRRRRHPCRLSRSLTAIHPATESPIKPTTPSGGFKGEPRRGEGGAGGGGEGQGGRGFSGGGHGPTAGGDG